MSQFLFFMFVSNGSSMLLLYGCQGGVDFGLMRGRVGLSLCGYGAG